MLCAVDANTILETSVAEAQCLGALAEAVKTRTEAEKTRTEAEKAVMQATARAEQACAAHHLMRCKSSVSNPRIEYKSEFSNLV